MDIGVIQGRLSEPVDGHIQEFPKDNWEIEFELLDSIGLTHIEWVITKKSFEGGVLDLDVSKYSDKISSICCDHLIDNRISDPGFLLFNLQPVCEFAIKNGIKTITIPLLEESSLCSDNLNDPQPEIGLFIESIHGFFNQNKLYETELEFLLEIENHMWLFDIFSNVRKGLFNFVYDTGNLTSIGIDHKEFINKYFDRINVVHLKDRTKDPIKTVEPFTGDTDFNNIFRELGYLEYKGKFTIQAARGETGKEVETIKDYKEKFKKLYDEKFV